MTVQNIDYFAVADDPALEEEFKSSVKQAVMANAPAWVNAQDMYVHLSPGSVIVEVLIGMRTKAAATSTANLFSEGASTLTGGVIASIAAIPGIELVAYGPPAISSVYFSSVAASGAVQSEAEVNVTTPVPVVFVPEVQAAGGTPGIVLGIVGALSVCVCCMCGLCLRNYCQSVQYEKQELGEMEDGFNQIESVLSSWIENRRHACEVELEEEAKAMERTERHASPHSPMGPSGRGLPINLSLERAGGNLGYGGLDPFVPVRTFVDPFSTDSPTRRGGAPRSASPNTGRVISPLNADGVLAE